MRVYGTHYLRVFSYRTLAVYSKKDKTFFHYDSASGSCNVLAARKVARAVQPYLK